MKKYLYDYIKVVDEKLNSNTDMESLKKEHLTKIQFFQHERLIHLIVTLFYVLFMIIFMSLSSLYIGFLFVGLILLVFVLFYVIHYFKLENGVQYLYKQYDKMK